MAELDPRTNTEDRVKPLGEVRPFPLGSEDRATMLEQSLSNNQVHEVGLVLTENRDLFAWTAVDMSGIHPDVISHKLSLFKDARPVAQKKRRMGQRKEERWMRRSVSCWKRVL